MKKMVFIKINHLNQIRIILKVCLKKKILIIKFLTRLRVKINRFSISIKNKLILIKLKVQVK